MFGAPSPLLRTATPRWREHHEVLHETYSFDWPEQDTIYTAPGEWGAGGNAAGVVSNGWEVGLSVTSVIVNIDINLSNVVDLTVRDSSSTAVGTLTTETLSAGSYELTVPVTLTGDDLLRVDITVATGDNYITRLRAIAGSSCTVFWTNHDGQWEINP